MLLVETSAVEYGSMYYNTAAVYIAYGDVSRGDD